MTARPLPDDQHAQALTFLRAVFGGKPDDARVVAWELATKRSRPFLSLDDAADWLTGRSDAYVHCALSHVDVAAGARISAAEAAGIPGVWLDVDIAHPVHKKPGLAADETAARAIIAAAGLAPTVVVHSGHGLQAWFCFTECWLFEKDDERRQAATLVRAWDISMRQRARGLGATLDAVGDLARLMRPAGTVNAKRDPHVGVGLLGASGPRYSADDIEAVLLDGTWAQAERELDGRTDTDATSYGDLVLAGDAEPPWEKLDALRDLEPRFDQAWRRKYSTRTEGWSSSEWDQSLANYAAQAGWSRQEIANLLIAVRRRHNDDLKLRQDYYRLTIDKATAGREEQEAVRVAVAVSEELVQAPPGERPEAERAGALGAISRSLGIEILRVTRSPSEPPVYGIETPYGSGSLGTIKVLANNQAFRNRVAEITNRFPRRLKNGQWDPIAQGLLQVAEPEELGVETTLAGKAETLVSLYLGNHARQVWADMSEKARAVLPIRLEPFVNEQGVPCVFLSGFKAWLAEHQHEQMTRTEIGTMLRAWGATTDTLHFRLDGRRTTRTVWRLPTTSGKGVDS